MLKIYIFYKQIQKEQKPTQNGRDSRPIWTIGKELSEWWIIKLLPDFQTSDLLSLLAWLKQKPKQHKGEEKKYISRRRKEAGSEAGGEESLQVFTLFLLPSCGAVAYRIERLCLIQEEWPRPVGSGVTNSAIVSDRASTLQLFSGFQRPVMGVEG